MSHRHDRTSSSLQHLLAADPQLPWELTAAVHECNELIAARMRTDPETLRMGTTIAAVLVAEDSLFVINAGDSRVYEATHVPCAPAVLTPLSVDHHDVWGGLTQCLGGSSWLEDIRPHIAQFDAASRRLLLCTDGLTNYVSDEAILDLLVGDGKFIDGDAAVEALTQLALANGGTDNITIVIVDVDNPGA